MPFLPSAAFPVDVLPSGRVRTLAPVSWHGYRGDVVDLAAGALSDWGTVPRLVRAVLPHDGPLVRAFLVHDELCRLVHAYQAALDAYAHRVRHLPGSQWGPSPEPPAFSAVDVDAVLRVILAEIGDAEAAAGRRRPFGTGPARWLYWAGCRAGALGSRARRRGFLAPRSLVPFLALAPVALVVLAPAAVGALVSRALLALLGALCRPWETRSRRVRAEEAARVRREFTAAATSRPCPHDGDPCWTGCEMRPECTAKAAAEEAR